jgi:hypothetical protein
MQSNSAITTLYIEHSAQEPFPVDVLLHLKTRSDPFPSDLMFYLKLGCYRVWGDDKSLAL